MEENSNVYPNNIINLTPEDFYKIIRGENHHYIYASTNSMAGARHEEERRADLGIPNYYPVNIPEIWYRHRPEQKYSMVPYEKWPDFSKPMINRIQGSVHFVYNIHPIWENQLLDSKKKLVRGININYCEFYGVVVWNEVSSDSFLRRCWEIMFGLQPQAVAA